MSKENKINNKNEYNILIDEHYQPNTRLLTNPNDSDLPKLGRKNTANVRKSVSFRNEVTVTPVENWKEFNHDVSEENEWYKLKQEVKAYKAMKKKKEQEEKCCCLIA